MGITLSKAGFLFHRGELDDPDTTKSSIPLIMHTIMVVFLLAHGMLFLRALRPTAFFSPPRPDIESGATIR